MHERERERERERALKGRSRYRMFWIQVNPVTLGPNNFCSTYLVKICTLSLIKYHNVIDYWVHLPAENLQLMKCKSGNLKFCLINWVRLDIIYFTETENWKYCNKIIFNCVNSTMRPIFNEKVVEKWDWWIKIVKSCNYCLWAVHEQ